MKRFNFGLAKVLELRKFKEEEAKVELGRAIGVLSDIENKIRLTAENRSSAAKQRFSGVTGMGGASAMISWNHYITRLDQETEKLLNDAAQAELIVEEKREAYLEASRELKVIEKLKEKREKEYRKEMFAAETRELDDIPRRAAGIGA